eukprot:CAMPEP_0177768638 /NCGR_PEP_ID=MMETSP0491_2-20121128/9833_1 /TAXON_ID=63592 /ORGANISM="Tetraselmis chuii, Strain PLY429" /LENGTH=523 /DNA_ID=CAMNT_0019285469 /DNA_START=235 /DNA_END=1806 /DNA_ORIENTATION=+
MNRCDSGFQATTSSGSTSLRVNGPTTVHRTRVSKQRVSVRLSAVGHHNSWTRTSAPVCDATPQYPPRCQQLALPGLLYSSSSSSTRHGVTPYPVSTTSSDRSAPGSVAAGRKHALHFEDTPLEDDNISRKSAPVSVATAVATAVASGGSGGQKLPFPDLCGDAKLLYDKVHKGTGNAASLDCVDVQIDENLFTLGWGVFDRQRFKAQGVLGSGGYGTVYLALDDVSGDLVAVKRIPKTRKSSAPSKVKRNLTKEASLLEYMQFCTSVVHLRDKFEDERNVYLVMDHLEGGSLEDYVQKNRRHITENDLAVITTVVLQFLAESHDVGICFADVKPSNFMLTYATAGHLAMRVIDFGCSQTVPEGGHLTQRCGTYKYFAPEVFHQHYGVEADMWSTGIMLYRMMTNSYPWWRSGTPITPAAAMEDICGTDPIPFPSNMWERWSPEAVEFIQFLLQRDPSKRPSAVEAMNHPWITSHVANYLKQEVADATANNIVPLAMSSTKWASVRDGDNVGDAVSTSMNCAGL